MHWLMLYMITTVGKYVVFQPTYDKIDYEKAVIMIILALCFDKE